jgi:small subunit ribosomal protein S18
MAKRRIKNKDNARRSKKKVSVLTQEQVTYVDWKDVNLLRRFMSDRAKIRARRVTGNNAQQQRQIAIAIKNAREMALLPYTSRVTTQRTPRDRDRGGRADAPMPMPTPATPPPAPGAAPGEEGYEEPTGLAPEEGFEAEVEAPADVEVEIEPEAVGAPAEEG